MDLVSHLGPHADFILGAYGFTALAIGGMIAAAIRDRRAQERALSSLRGADAERRP